MEESDTYLMILDEGQAKGFREGILLLGVDRLGPPDEAAKTALASITDLDRLKRIVLQTQKAASWQALLETP